jgi:hypothetical protein
MMQAVRIAVVAILVCALSYAPFLFMAWREAQASHGFFSVEQIIRESSKPALIAGATILGIVCGTLFSVLGHEAGLSTLGALRKALSMRAIVLAGLVAPIVVAGVHEEISKLDSSVILALICYQNGFFWESVVSSAKKSA